MSEEKKLVIPQSMWPEKKVERLRGADGQNYLVENDVWFTAVKHSRGEFSRFFIELCDNTRILAHRCPSCKQIIIPPFQKRCPQCDFTEMVEEYIKDVGVMVATPVITAFAPSRFKDEIPFGTGYVFLETHDGELTDTALAVRVKTTTGAIRPGIFEKNTPIKIVFNMKRVGNILEDIFAVPQSELTAKQIATTPLFNVGLFRATADQIKMSNDPELMRKLEECVSLFHDLSEKIRSSPRARDNLSLWFKIVKVKTPAGDFELRFYDEAFAVSRNNNHDEELTFIVNDPNPLILWLRNCLGEDIKSQALTDLILEGEIIMDKPELETINRLDRIPRSLRRDGVV